MSVKVDKFMPSSSSYQLYIVRLYTPVIITLFVILELFDLRTTCVVIPATHSWHCPPSLSS